MSKSKSTKKSELTRKAILESAREAFVKHGYDQVGVREICSGAGVNCALVNRYFGSKLGLFREVLLDDTDYSELYAGPISQLGERLAQFLLAGTITKKSGEPLSVDPQKMLLFMRSVGCPDALPVLREALHQKVTSLLMEVLPPPFIREKSALITSHIFGFIAIHRIVGAACVVKADKEAIAHQLARSLQVLIDYGIEDWPDPSDQAASPQTEQEKEIS
jgi:AcrR family transcriptional regulator